MRGNLLLTAVLMVAAGPGPEPIELRLRLEPGQSYGLRVVVDQQIEQTLMSERRKVSQVMEYAYTFRVDGVDDRGVAAVTVTYDSAKVSRELSDEVFGDEPAAPAVQADAAARNALFGALTGQQFTMRVEPSGRVLEVGGTDAVVAKLSESLAPATDEERELLGQSLREQFGREATRETMERLLAVFPDKPVSVGDSWERTVAMTKGFPLRIASTYTLKGVEDGAALIEVKANVTADPRPIANPPGTGSFHYDLNGGQSGSIALATDTGWYRSAALDLRAHGHVAYDKGRDLKKTVAPMSLQSKMTIGNPVP